MVVVGSVEGNDVGNIVVGITVGPKDGSIVG